MRFYVYVNTFLFYYIFVHLYTFMYKYMCVTWLL
uniref:Uncharacterized protein n=1 Tax=Anguilla anguilla TaxID=7936 RepID=A0A0E9QM81_ANGAN